MDQRVREAQRRYEASGNPQDGARWLRLRMSAGELVGDQVKMAARLGYQPARIIYPGQTICDGLDEMSADEIADNWVEFLNVFPVMYASLLFLCNDILKELLRADEEPVGLDVLSTIYDECLSAFNGGSRFVDPRGDILLGWAAGERDQYHFAIMAIYNLAEMWAAYELDMHREAKGFSEMCIYNCVEFSTYTIELRCERLSQFLIPWVLSEFPPNPATIANQLSLNQE